MSYSSMYTQGLDSAENARGESHTEGTQTWQTFLEITSVSPNLRSKDRKVPSVAGTKKVKFYTKSPGEPHKLRKVTSAPWVGFFPGIEVAGLDGLWNPFKF